MYTWKISKQKYVTLRGGLEFKLKCHLNSKRERSVDLLGESKWFLRKMNEPLEE